MMIYHLLMYSTLFPSASTFLPFEVISFISKQANLVEGQTQGSGVNLLTTHKQENILLACGWIWDPTYGSQLGMMMMKLNHTRGKEKKHSHIIFKCFTPLIPTQHVHSSEIIKFRKLPYLLHNSKARTCKICLSSYNQTNWWKCWSLIS